MVKGKKAPKYIVLCKPIDGKGGSALHFTSQTSEKLIKKIFATFIKSREKQATEYSILFYTQNQQFKQGVATARKFFQKKRLETAVQRIAKKDSYFVKRDKWWRPPKTEYKKRTYPVVKWKCFTTEELVPLWNSFQKDKAYLDRTAITRIVANFLNSRGFPTPNMETRYKTFKRLFSRFWDCQIHIHDEYLQKTIQCAGTDKSTLQAEEDKMFASARAAKKMNSAWFRNEKFVDLICGKLTSKTITNIIG